MDGFKLRKSSNTRKLATYDETLGALRKARAKFPENETPSVDALAEAAKKFLAVPKEYFESFLQRARPEDRIELGYSARPERRSRNLSTLP